MPSDFWVFAGLGLAFVGWGLMRLLVAKADSIEWETSRKRNEQ